MKKFSELDYVRPDMEKIMADIRRDIEALKAAESFESFKAAYMAYVQTDIELSTARTLAHIRNTINMLDTYYEEEMAFFHSWMPKYELLVKEIGKVILDSPFRQNMNEEFGPILLQNMEAKQLLSSEAIIDDMTEESRLSNLYSKTVATASANFRGNACTTYELLKHMQSVDRSERREAFEAWASLYESIAPKIDDIYDKLVRLRSGMAHKLGFKSFIPMGYYKRRRYDYTAEDLNGFRKQVREVIVPVCVKLYERHQKALGIDSFHYYDELLSSPEGNPCPIGDRNALVEKAQAMYRELSPESGEFFDFMVKYELFDLEARKGKRVGGYSSTLTLYHAPFIFSNFNGTKADINVLTHEAGHAFASYTAAKFQKLPELCHSTSEINEIHSMSMELWTYPWMESFFGDRAEQYRRSHLADALMKIPYMVCVDEFQHKVYENPEITAMERRALWKSLEKIYMPWRDYDGNPFMEDGGFWMQKQHIFLYPFYYVEYALAQIGAFEFYEKAKIDRETAWADYYKLCKAGGSMGYFKLLESCGLHNLFQEGSVQAALAALFEELDV